MQQQTSVKTSQQITQYDEKENKAVVTLIQLWARVVNAVLSQEKTSQKIL